MCFSVPSPPSVQVQASVVVPSSLSPLDSTITPAISSVVATPISLAPTTSYAPAASPTAISAASVTPNAGDPNLGSVASVMWRSDSGDTFDFTACDFGASSVSANMTGLPGMAPSAQHSFLDMLNSRALHSPTSLCRLYIDYRESTGSPLGVKWEWSGSAHQDHVDGRST